MFGGDAAELKTSHIALNNGDFETTARYLNLALAQALPQKVSKYQADCSQSFQTLVKETQAGQFLVLADRTGTR